MSSRAQSCAGIGNDIILGDITIGDDDIIGIMSFPRNLPDQPRRPPFLVRTAHQLEDAIMELNWRHIAFKVCAYSYISLMLWFTWVVLPLPGHWDRPTHSDKIPITYQDFPNYFGAFNGFAECNIRASNLYSPPGTKEDSSSVPNKICHTRRTLLQAMSDGGRVGFDSPYIPKGCHFRWYSVAEICMIVERFDSLVFVGDYALQTIYNGLNILLRQDLASGAMKSWDIDHTTRDECRCNSQFVKQSCAEQFITSSDEVVQHTPAKGNTYFCQRIPHAMLRITDSPAPSDVIAKFNKLVPQVPRSNYKPVPIIHSLSLSSASTDTATKSMLEFLKLADASERKTPMLWIGPSAAGHVDVKGRKGNQEVWDYDRSMAKTAQDNDIEVLKMWNMTIQAESYDGLRFGEKVAITQAMMVINWLGLLESS